MERQHVAPMEINMEAQHTFVSMEIIEQHGDAICSRNGGDKNITTRRHIF